MAENKAIKPSGEEPFAVMERADEDQIVASIRGAYLEGMVYKFSMAGRQVVGVSWSGIKEIAYQLARETGRAIDVKILEVHEDAETITYTVEASHKGIGTRVGVATQAKMFGNKMPDQFARVKALSKAQRNAIRAVLPELSIKQFIEESTSKGKTYAPPANSVDAEYNIRDNTPVSQPPEPTTNDKPKDKQGRWQDEKGYWNGDDAGFSDVPGLPELPAYYSVPLQEVGLDSKSFTTKIYKGTPVVAIAGNGYLAPEDWKKANPVFKKLGLAYCKAGKSNHWFVLPGSGRD